jgi:hypothetical protein
VSHSQMLNIVTSLRLKMGFGWVIGFIRLLQTVTTINSNATANLHTLQSTESSQSAVSSLLLAW